MNNKKRTNEEISHNPINESYKYDRMTAFCALLDGYNIVFMDDGKEYDTLKMKV